LNQYRKEKSIILNLTASRMQSRFWFPGAGFVQISIGIALDIDYRPRKMSFRQT